MPEPLLSKDDVLEKFSNIVANSLKVDPTEVTENTYLDDLGADSLDLLEITVDVEEQLHITLPEKDIFHTVRQVFGEGILEKEGLLTDEGKKFLLRRMPDLNPALEQWKFSAEIIAFFEDDLLTFVIHVNDKIAKDIASEVSNEGF